MSDRPKLVQCLCPNRHCVVALLTGAHVSEAEALAFLKQAVDITLHPARYSSDLVDALRERGMPIGSNPWCGLCGAKSDTWSYQAAPAKDGWDAAVAEARELEHAQGLTRELWNALGLSFEQPTPVPVELMAAGKFRSTDQTLWKCRDCGALVWLQTGVDPNVQRAASPRLMGKLGKDLKQ